MTVKKSDVKDWLDVEINLAKVEELDRDLRKTRLQAVMEFVDCLSILNSTEVNEYYREIKKIGDNKAC